MSEVSSRLPRSDSASPARRRPARSAHERGQVLVETAIIMPIMVFLVLGALQIMMMQHGKTMTEYAAYNAARAGIVHNADWNVMRNAALIASLPLYERTDTLGNFAKAWAKVKLLAEATEALDRAGATVEQLMGDLLGIGSFPQFIQNFSLVEVEVTSPRLEEFRAAEDWQMARQAEALAIDPRGPLAFPDGEIDFDDSPMLMDENVGPRPNRLAVDVRVLYPLKVPVVNWIIFQLWYAQEALRVSRVESDLQEWAQMQGRITRGPGTGRTLEEYVSDTEGAGPFDDFLRTTKWQRELRTLRWLAVEENVYLIPLHATYAMQMQSNAFYSTRREPSFFSIRP